MKTMARAASRKNFPGVPLDQGGDWGYR